MKSDKIWCFDIDGVICDTEGTDYPNSIPKSENIEKINRIYDKGHYIKLFTGRGSVSGIDWKSVTEHQLKEWGVKYHELIFGKPHFDVFIDDLAYNSDDFEGFDFDN